MAQTINVNTTPGQFMPTLYYSQGDIGREFEIVLASSDGWSIPAGATVTMVATKPSGFGFTVAGTLTDNVASFTTTETMTNEHGRYPAEIRIASGTDVIGTANFYLSGEKDPHPAETIDGDASEIIPELTLLVERVETAASSVLDMTVNASTLSAGSQATYSYDEETNTATFGIPQGEAGAGAAGVTASAYSSSRTYAVGDYVIHNSNLYRCTTAITTTEAFTAAHWTQVVLADDVSDVKSAISYTDENLNKVEDTTILKHMSVIEPDSTVNGRGWYKYNATTASYVDAAKYSYKSYVVADLPDTVIINTYVLDMNECYFFLDDNNKIILMGWGDGYRIYDVVRVPRNATKLYVNFATNYATTAFDPYGVREFSSYSRKEEKEAVPTKALVPDETYAGYFTYTSNNSPYVMRFQDNSDYTSYMKRVHIGDKFRIKSSYFAQLAGYALTDVEMKTYFVKHTTSSGALDYDDSITIAQEGFLFYTRRYATDEFYEQHNKIDVVDTVKSPLYGKKIAFDGDSITMASDAGTTGYVEQIQLLTGCVPQNLAVDGGTITSGTVIAGTTTPRHHVCESIINADADTDIYCISGGLNDWGMGQSAIGTYVDTIGNDPTVYDSDTLIGALDYIFTWLMVNRSGKPILFIFTHNPLNYKINHPAGGLSYDYTYAEWNAAIRKVCEKYSVPYVDLFNKTPLMTIINNEKPFTLNNDGVHPTTAGYKQYYVPQILTALESICPRTY